ncbi:hypothetical protein TWF718_002942 [Orbilia javanica]|uniref:C2H2-type domain-containing protein n=1 Tax=Orbilia javanica TaxID=47235 RepID=A0AAN8MP42_9PEZI
MDSMAAVDNVRSFAVNTADPMPTTTSSPAALSPASKYHCSICNTPFSNQRLFSDHTLNVHNKRAFKCRICGVEVARFDNLNNHIKSRHADAARVLETDKSIVKRLACPAPTPPTPQNDWARSPGNFTTTGISSEECQSANVFLPSGYLGLPNQGPRDVYIELAQTRAQLDNANLEINHWKSSYFGLLQRFKGSVDTSL